MTEQTPPQEEDLGVEFRAFGDHLRDMLHAAWERPERQQLQNEIANGLNELRTSLRQASDEFAHSDVGQRVKSGVEDIRTRVETGEVEKTIRKDLGKAMHVVNAELQKLAEKLRTSSDAAGKEE
jgi:hypothetical protein